MPVVRINERSADGHDHERRDCDGEDGEDQFPGPLLLAYPCDWVLDLLNVWPGDEAVDLFPGTGVMGRRAAALSPTVPPEGLFAEVAP